MKILTAFVLLTASAWAGPVTLKVDVVGDKESQVHGKQSKSKKSGIPERVTTDTRQLEITVGNTTTREWQNLTVIYYLFAKDAKEKDILLSKKGQKNISLHSLGKESFVSENAVITFHSLSSKTKEGKTETTPASGAKFAGYGVQVLSGTELLAEVFEPRELKASASLTETSTLYDEDKWKKKKKSN